ncbi:MAG: plastocyanin/azurin family copper-binding protein [Candidatus Limnocylindria bacterium]
MKQRNVTPLPRPLLLALAALLLASCAAAEPEVDITKGQIRADLREHAITLTSNEVRAGEVTFVVRNRGGQAHDLIVIRTDLAADALPVDGQTQMASEEGRAGGIELVSPGRSANLRLTLEPGHYVLICNVPTHYGLGMHTELEVR